MPECVAAAVRMSSRICAALYIGGTMSHTHDSAQYTAAVVHMSAPFSYVPCEAYSLHASAGAVARASPHIPVAARRSQIRARRAAGTYRQSVGAYTGRDALGDCASQTQSDKHSSCSSRPLFMRTCAYPCASWAGAS